MKDVDFCSTWKFELFTENLISAICLSNWVNSPFSFHSIDVTDKIILFLSMSSIVLWSNITIYITVYTCLEVMPNTSTVIWRKFQIIAFQCIAFQRLLFWLELFMVFQ